MEDYRTFWTNVTSTRVLVTASESENDIMDPIPTHFDEKNYIDYNDMEVSESRTPVWFHAQLSVVESIQHTSSVGGSFEIP